MAKEMTDRCIEIPEKTESIKDFITRTIITILGKAGDDGFSLERSLMEMGLDSEALSDLTKQIGCRYQILLKPVFFFKHNTAERIISYLQET